MHIKLDVESIYERTLKCIKTDVLNIHNLRHAQLNNLYEQDLSEALKKKIKIKKNKIISRLVIGT